MKNNWDCVVLLVNAINAIDEELSGECYEELCEAVKYLLKDRYTIVQAVVGDRIFIINKHFGTITNESVND